MTRRRDGARAGCYAIRGATLLKAEGVVAADLVWSGSRIIAGPESETPLGSACLDGLQVAPGFIDLQVNGAFGHDFTRDPEAIWDVGRRLAEHGVTAFLPTIITSPLGAIARAMEVLAVGPPEGYLGAAALGLHLEGPFLSKAQRGVHPEEYLALPSKAPPEGWSRAAGIVLVTLAPELDGALDLIRRLTAAGIAVSVGHTDGDWQDVGRAAAAGATMGTHLFNAMSGVDHRRPGVATSLLSTPTLRAGIIVDGHHVHPEAIRLAWAAKGPAGLALTTDSVAAAGIGDGEYSLGRVRVASHGGEARDQEGRLAGSTLTLDAAVGNLIAYTGCEPCQAVQAASSTPAAVLGDRARGGLDCGQRADFVVLDGHMLVQATVIGGRPCYDPQHLFPVPSDG